MLKHIKNPGTFRNITLQTYYITNILQTLHYKHITNTLQTYYITNILQTLHYKHYKHIKNPGTFRNATHKT